MWILFLCLIVITALYLGVIFPETSRTKQLKLYRDTMFAHRGLHFKNSGIPENSMAAFRLAVKHGYGIELDVHLTSDDRLVVFHDHSLERMCGLKENIESMSYRQLSQLKLDKTKEKIPLLEDVLKLVNGKVPLLIEVKVSDDYNRISHMLYHSIKTYSGTYLVQSFHTGVLHWFRKNAPGVLRGQLSNNLTASNPETPFFYRFAVKYLFCNIFGRPDFISYKLDDLPMFNLTLLRRFWNVPIAVWTLRSREALAIGKEKYEMQIFEYSAYRNPEDSGE